MSRYVEPTRPKPWGAIYTPPPPEEPTDMPDTITVAQLRAFAADLPDKYLFGAIKRFRDEVALDRDRLPDAVVKAADGTTDIWTGDMMTGGAVGYFLRAYVTEGAIAYANGANILDASVEGFKAAERTYNAGPGKGRTDGRGGTGEVPPSGTLRGPIGVSGRDFEVPGL